MASLINRKDDLLSLDALWRKKGAQFVVVYGRRRVGKTVLLAHFADTKKFLHWLAYRATPAELLKDLSQALHAHLYPRQTALTDFSYGSWQALFETLALHGKSARVGLVIDEFPYLVESDPTFPTILQALWDKPLIKTNVFLVLSGSSLGMMKEHVLSAKAPLYGRATAILPIQPIDIKHFGEFFPRYSPVQRLEVYGVTGGIPKYFEFFADQKPVLKALEILITDKSSLLNSEPDFLLHEEFRETRLYLAILRGLGAAVRDINGIAVYTGISTKILSKYLDDLIQLKMVRRHTPATTEEGKSRKGRYKIRDHFLAFYFRFIAPFHGEWEREHTEGLINNLKKNFDAYIGGQVFEELCQEFIRNAAARNELPFIPARVGAYWDREIQIDVIGMNPHDQVALVGECKWTNKPLALATVNQLEDKVRLLRRQWDYTYHLYCFSRAGFTAEALRLCKKKGYHCLGLKEIVTVQPDWQTAQNKAPKNLVGLNGYELGRALHKGS